MNENNQQTDEQSSRERHLIERLVSLADLSSSVAEDIIELSIERLYHYQGGMIDPDLEKLKISLKKKIPQWPSCL